ncbi:MAG: thioredoxin family protein [Verrucomicrobiaceae bacterium]|nr:MAG: thioredoxin family protein [Verrucomicrobiaceae bacterium]
MKTLFKTLAVLTASASLALAGGEHWMTDWEAAKAKSKAENKPILINLTGSDWCTWCIKIEKEVFSQKAFQDFATENVIMFEADFPKKPENKDKQSAEQKKQNAALEKEYLNKGYPTVYLLDAEGKKLSEDIGELKGGTDAYIAKIKEVIASQKK